jgi:hypothetical protein
MMEVVVWLIDARPVRAMARAMERCMSYSERRRPWCARGGEECEGRKGLPEGAVTVASYLAEVSLKWLSEVS